MISSRGPHALLGVSNAKSFLARATSGAFLVKAGAAALGLLLSIVLARALGATAYGTYSYAIAWAGLLAILTPAGFPRVLVRVTALASKNADWPTVRGLLRLSTGITLGLSVVAPVGAFAVAGLLRAETAAKLAYAVALACLAVPFLASATIYQSALQGLGRIVLGQAPDLVVRPLLLLIGILAVWIGFEEPISVTQVLVLQIASSAVISILVLLLWLNYRPTYLSANPPVYEARRWLASAAPLLLLSGTMVVNDRADVIMLGTLMGSEPVGLYAVASRGGQLVSFVLQALNVAIAPLLATVYADSDRRRLQRLMVLTARLVFFSALAVALLLAVFGPKFLELFGPEFHSAYSPMLILVCGQLVNAFTGSVGVLLIMSGHERLAATSALVAAATNIGANSALIPQFGMHGAAFATALSMVIWNALMGYFVYRHIRIVPTAAASSRPSLEK